MKKVILLLSSIVLPAVLLLAGCMLTRLGYESPGYKITQRDDQFEIRTYGSLAMVSAPMGGSVEKADDSFMKLFRYISKNNEAGQKISMTTPVLMTGDDSGRRMNFLMPKEMSASDAPAPKETGMKVGTFAAGRYAVVRFSGSLTDKSVKDAEQRLRKWAARQRVSLQGSAIVAGYDPPFTPPPLRRNEVMIQVAE